MIKRNPQSWERPQYEFMFPKMKINMQDLPNQCVTFSSWVPITRERVTIKDADNADKKILDTYLVLCKKVFYTEKDMGYMELTNAHNEFIDFCHRTQKNYTLSGFSELEFFQKSETVTYENIH